LSPHFIHNAQIYQAQVIDEETVTLAPRIPGKERIVLSIQRFEFKWKHLIFVPEMEMTSVNGISALFGDECVYSLCWYNSEIWYLWLWPLVLLQNPFSTCCFFIKPP
jgi:hypothetical protein